MEKHIEYLVEELNWPYDIAKDFVDWLVRKEYFKNEN